MSVLVVVPVLVPVAVLVARGFVPPGPCGGLDGQMGAFLAFRYSLGPGVAFSGLAVLAHRAGYARRSWVLVLLGTYALAAATFFALASDWCT